MNIGTVLACIL